MKTWSPLPALAAVLVTATLATIPSTAAAEETPPAKPDDMAAMMAAAREMAKPVAEHQKLAALAGTWDQTYQMPGAPPLKGTSVNTPILGGRFLELKVAGGEGDFRVEGLTVLGFDRRANQYTLVGFDTWGTYYVTAAGAWDEAAKAWKLPGENKDPQTGRTETYTFVLRPEGPDRYVMEVLFHMPDGQTVKAVEITSTRRK
ncbi:MAG TPA: DUF1579 family protein [Thermoanaerobaculia bacterium]|nr:DUF1579 family protein [Thermoanaerobaculia bacterium]